MVSRSANVGGVVDEEYYVYDGNNVALVLSPEGEVTERELYGPAVNQILASESVAYVVSGPQAAGTVSLLLTDNQGTVRDVAKYDSGTSTTTIVDHLVYDAFGTITHQSDSTNQPRFGYAGMQLDSVTKLYNDAARWYDAVNGVFSSQDPIGFNDGGTNLAMYCANTPTNLIDPSGKDGETDDEDNDDYDDFGDGARAAWLQRNGFSPNQIDQYLRNYDPYSDIERENEYNREPGDPENPGGGRYTSPGGNNDPNTTRSGFGGSETDSNSELTVPPSLLATPPGEPAPLTSFLSSEPLPSSGSSGLPPSENGMVLKLSGNADVPPSGEAAVGVSQFSSGGSGGGTSGETPVRAGGGSPGGAEPPLVPGGGASSGALKRALRQHKLWHG